MYLRNTTRFVTHEIELLRLKLKFPDQFSQESKEIFKSDLNIIPKSKLGIIAIAEIVLAISLTKDVKDASGKPVSLMQLSKAFEYIFNFKFGDIYDKCNEIFNRKSVNLTKTLDYLVKTMEKEDRKKRQNQR